MCGQGKSIFFYPTAFGTVVIITVRIHCRINAMLRSCSILLWPNNKGSILGSRVSNKAERQLVPVLPI